ncbi:MAG: hypothetical protein ACRD8U_19360 [Pyrinomonadaceae bacterium]
MEYLKFLPVILSLILLTGCVSGMRNAEAPGSVTQNEAQSSGNKSNFAYDSATRTQEPGLQEVSLSQADQSQSMAEAMNRKILSQRRNKPRGNISRGCPTQNHIDRRVAGWLHRHFGIETT